MEAITFPESNKVNSVLPPPTSTYKKVLSEFVNSDKSVIEIIAASSLPSITSMLILHSFFTSLTILAPFSAFLMAEVAHALYFLTP